jgi:hypothetical protein
MDNDSAGLLISVGHTAKLMIHPDLVMLLLLRFWLMAIDRLADDSLLGV